MRPSTDAATSAQGYGRSMNEYDVKIRATTEWDVVVEAVDAAQAGRIAERYLEEGLVDVLECEPVDDPFEVTVGSVTLLGDEVAAAA